MTETQIYAGIVLAGVCASQAQPLMMGVHRKLERELGVDLPRWADVTAFVTSWIAGLALAVGCGAVLGMRSDTLGHDAWIGGVWGLLGGVVGPQLWPMVKKAGASRLRGESRQQQPDDSGSED